MTRRVVAWFSRGAASAVATKLALAEHPEVIIACTRLTTEHPDSERFALDCEHWFGQEIVYLESEKYADTWAVWEGVGFITSPQGAPCTGALKKAPRFAFQRPDDLQVFGYTSEEAHRRERLLASDPTINLSTPLITHGIGKKECLARVTAAGIELPAMYRLGYANNNCIGCPKGGMGYWNRIRVDFPEVFTRMAKLERRLGYAVLSEERAGPSRKKFPVWLDELDPSRGRFSADQPQGCSFTCQPAFDFPPTETEVDL